METIKILYHDKEIEHVKKIAKGDWIDLRAANDYTLKQGDFQLINLGVSIKIPDGYEAHLAPRSSTFKNYGIIQTNSVGVIDGSYCGNGDVWMMPVYCLEPREYKDGQRVTVIKKNDRICQFRIVESQPAVAFEEVESLSDESRGGFGSTGVN